MRIANIVYYRQNVYHHRGFHKNPRLLGQLLGKMKMMLVVGKSKVHILPVQQLLSEVVIMLLDYCFVLGQ